MKRALTLATLLALSPLTAYGQSAYSGLIGRRVIDIDGKIWELGGREANRALALVFVHPDCEASAGATSLLKALAERAPERLQLVLVVADAELSRAAALKYRQELGLEGLIFDGDGALTRALKPRRSGEAFLIDARGALRYRGAADAGGLGAAAGALMAGKPVPRVAGAASRGRVINRAGLSLEKVKAAVSYNRHMAPILDRACVHCHRPNEAAPFSLQTYGDVRKRASFLAQITRSRTMPPWMPMEGHGDFLEENRLSADEIALFEAWAKAGAPRGAAEDARRASSFESGWRLGEPDLVISMSEAYTVKAEGDDEFRVFVLPTGLTEDRELIGFDLRPGSPAVVHHALMFLDDSGRARQLDERSEGYGYPSSGGVSVGFNAYGLLGGYVPGRQPTLLPDGVARRVKKNSDVLLQVHYHSSGKVEKDKSTLALYFAKEKKPRTQLGDFFMGTTNIDIKPGDKRYRRHAAVDLPVDVEVIGVWPHMHYLGTSIKIWARLPDGRDVPMISIDQWDFRWQGQYYYRKPLKLPAGTRVMVTSYYDNSADNSDNPTSPPKRVRFGQQSTDEMCVGLFIVTTKNERDQRRLQRAGFMSFQRSRDPKQQIPSPETEGPRMPEAPKPEPKPEPKVKPAKKKRFY